MARGKPSSMHLYHVRHDEVLCHGRVLLRSSRGSVSGKALSKV